MRYQPRVSLPSSTGVFRKSFAGDPEYNHMMRNTHRRNRQQVMLLLISWTSLLGDSPLGYKPNRTIASFISKLTKDPTKVIAQFSNLAHQISLTLYNGADGVIIDSFIEEMRDTPIFYEYLRFYQTRDATLFQYIYSFLNFGKKLRIEDPDLDATSLRGWLETEERLSSLVVPEWADNLAYILRFVFKDWKQQPFLPKHGSGAVAEPNVRGVTQKNSAMVLSAPLAYLYQHFAEYIGMGSSAFPFTYPVGSREHVRRVSRLKFVPKTYKTSRSICMEPASYQWAQQGIRQWLESYLRKSILRSNIQLKDQKANQLMACYGSRYSTVDTIDLSSASDSVLWLLILAVFPAGILKHLQATRTSEVELPDGSVVAVHKFAPMGSALCFPVQSTLYSAIVAMVGIARQYSLDWRTPGIFKRNLRDMETAWRSTFDPSKPYGDRSHYADFRCYGDDITCDQQLTSDVVEALTLLGFKVNDDKSFTGSRAFRESCGEHYLRGESVTPYILKLKKLDRKVNVESLSGVIDAANRAGEYGYSCLRRHLIQYALYCDIHGTSQLPAGRANPILFVSDKSDESYAIRCSNPRNTHLRSRSFDPTAIPEMVKLHQGTQKKTNYLFMRDEYHSITVGPKNRTRLRREDDDYRHVLWWRSAPLKAHRRHGGQYDSGLPVPQWDTLATGVAWRWTSKP